MRLVTVISVSLCLCLQTISAQLLPKADDTSPHDSIPADMRQSYTAYGEK